MRPTILTYLILFTISVAVIGLSSPRYNMDMIGYAGAVYSWTTHDKTELHQSVYSELRRTVDDRVFKGLVSGDYRSAMAADPEVFHENLSYYKPRVFYLLAVKILSLLGVNIFTATQLVSVLGILFGMGVLVWSFRDSINWSWLAIPPLAMVFKIYDVARLSCPAGLVFLVIAVCVHLFRMRGFVWLLYCLALLPLVRTDTLPFIFPFIIYVWITSRNAGIRMIAFGSCFYGIVGVLAAQYLAHHPGWLVTLQMTFGHNVIRPLTDPIRFPLADYPKLVAWVLERIPLSFGVFGLLLWPKLDFYPIRNFFCLPYTRRRQFLPFAMLFYVLAHFAIFPALWERFFLGPYMVVAFLVLAKEE